ncbi:MAG TPA: adenosylmethionine--8-amino-7-oxononanoate transaminase [Planctomycetaceae bacterium]|nr:adenosylmethionine--8-amino-7-oxononanoate transaminase [Planctomycetaceae bacterium]
MSLSGDDARYVWHPFTPMQAYATEAAPVIVSGEGFELIDESGRRYLDGVSSLWCNVHGHQVAEIDQAIRDQLDRVAHTTLLGLGNDPSIRLARRLVDVTPPGLDHVFFSDSGSTAVEVALKIAWQFHRQAGAGGSQRDLFVGLDGAYHGDTIGSVSLGQIDLFHSVYGPLLFDTLTVPAPVAFRHPRGVTDQEWLEHCEEELERVLRAHQDRIAGVVIEPLVQGAAGILVHPEGYLRRLRELTSELGLLLIADEVAVGFGRTGRLFGCEHEEVVPDLLCLAKGLTGGYLPLAATLATGPIFDAFLGEPHEGRTFFHGHTYTGNALGCAAALASLDLFQVNDVLANVAEMTVALESGLATLDGHDHVGQVRQRGVMVGIELVADRDGNVPFAPERRTGHRVTLAARRRGVILRPLGDVVVLMPAPAMPVDDVERLVEIAIESIDEATGATAAGR